MLPFDRLIRAMDRWAAANPQDEVFAQIGDSSYKPSHMRWVRLLSLDEFAAALEECSIVIAHAGTGSFFVAAERMKPIVMFPRRAEFREHTTDHQVHTARWLGGKPGVYTAMTESELEGAIAEARARPKLTGSRFQPYAPEPFLLQIRKSILR